MSSSRAVADYRARRVPPLLVATSQTQKSSVGRRTGLPDEVWAFPPGHITGLRRESAQQNIKGITGHRLSLSRPRRPHVPPRRPDQRNPHLHRDVADGSTVRGVASTDSISPRRPPPLDGVLDALADL